MSDKKGFSGLDSLSTDIDDIIRENDKRIEDNTEQKKENKDNISNSNNDIADNVEKSNINTDSNSNTSNVASDNSNNGSSSLIWLLIAMGIFIWILSNSSSSNKSTYSSTSNSNTNNKYESAKSDQECYSKGMYPSKHYSDGSVLCSSSSVESLSSSSQQNYNTNTSSDDYYESKPDAYLSILNKNQLLYCEAEKIRLDAVQNKIDFYSTYEVDTYNSLSNDYNGRCANKQYYKNDMYYVDRNIEKKRYQLQQDGLARFSKSNSISPNSQGYNSNQTLNVNSKILYSLTINTLPSDAKVKIVNITPKYQNRIKLEKGSYHIEVSKDGYETIDQWITLNQDMIYTAELKKNSTNNTYSTSPNNYSSPSYQSSPAKSPNNGMPANAIIDYTGHSWVCKDGYRQYGNECLKVQMPANAIIDYTGHSWVCKDGFFQSGNECLKVQMPANAIIDYTGHSWVCKDGYRQYGNECIPVGVIK